MKNSAKGDIKMMKSHTKEVQSNQTDIRKGRRTGRSSCPVLRCFGTFLFSIFLTALLLLLGGLLFLHGLAGNDRLPSIRNINGAWLTNVCASWYLLVLTGIFIGIQLVILALINVRRVRNLFLSIGVSSMVSGTASALSGIWMSAVIEILPGAWQDCLINTTVVLKSFFHLYSAVLVIIGMIFLSISFSVRIVRGR